MVEVTQQKQPADMQAESSQSRCQQQDNVAVNGEAQARYIIATYRRKLEWLLLVPEWDSMWTQGLEALKLPLPRRGVGLRGLLQGLLLEQKRALICWALDHFRGLFPGRLALRVCAQLDLDLFDVRVLDRFLSTRQWLSFRDALHFDLSMRHRRYKRAQQFLFDRYCQQVEQIVRRKVFSASRREDALQEGMLGLLHAIDKCSQDERSFASYAQMWITRQVKNHLINEHFPVHVPINKAVDFLVREEPTSASSVRRSAMIPRGISVDDAAGVKEIVGLLYDPTGESPRGAVTRQDMRAVVVTAMQQLSDQERQILLHRHAAGDRDKAPLRVLAARYDCSIQQISTIERKALTKLKKLLQPYLQEWA